MSQNIRFTRRAAVPAWQGHVARFVRGWRPDRNRLRRAIDRAEVALLAGLLAAFLAGAPVAAVSAYQWALAAGLRAAHAEQASWHPVRAVLLVDTPGPIGTPYGIVDPLVPAQWTAGGESRTAMVGVDHRARAGSVVEIWTDASGWPSGRPPLNPGQVAQQAALAAIAAPIVLAVVLLIVGTLARWALNKRRLAAWDADWQLTEPRWTSRR